MFGRNPFNMLASSHHCIVKALVGVAALELVHAPRLRVVILTPQLRVAFHAKRSQELFCVAAALGQTDDLRGVVLQHHINAIAHRFLLRHMAPSAEEPPDVAHALGVVALVPYLASLLPQLRIDDGRRFRCGLACLLCLGPALASSSASCP